MLGSRARRPKQLELRKYVGCAGRKPKGEGRKNVPHRARAAHVPTLPVHVVLRSELGSLRRQRLFPVVRRALFRPPRARANFRIMHFSVQADRRVCAGDESRLRRRRLSALCATESRVAPVRGSQGLRWRRVSAETPKAQCSAAWRVTINQSSIVHRGLRRCNSLVWSRLDSDCELQIVRQIAAKSRIALVVARRVCVGDVSRLRRRRQSALRRRA